MNSFKALFVLAIVMTLIIETLSSTTQHDKHKDNDELDFNQFAKHHGNDPSHFFKHEKKNPFKDLPPWVPRPRGSATCDKFPRVCHVKGSPGPDCCKKRCVNVKIDNLNCGMCGNKCRYPEVCCNGRCVNPLHDRKHCGGCHNKCNRGSVCYNGMCNYA